MLKYKKKDLEIGIAVKALDGKGPLTKKRLTKNPRPSTKANPGLQFFIIHVDEAIITGRLNSGNRNSHNFLM